MSVKCGHCREHHDTVSEVRECSRRHLVVLTERHPGFSAVEPGSIPVAPTPEAPRTVSDRDVAAARSRMFGGTQTAPRERKRAEEGIYRKAGSIYRVVTAHHGSGLRYAQRLTETATIAKNGKPKFKWVMAKGFVFELRSEHLLTLEEAQEFGKLYGTCCICGAILTNPESIERGIGPTCAVKFR
jgi:uncharacterized protein DUF6011